MSINYNVLTGLLLDDNNFPELMKTFEHYIPGIYDDGKHIATIGIGTNVKQVEAYLALTLKELGVFQPIAGETDAHRNVRYDIIIQGFQTILDHHSLTRTTKVPGTDDSEIALQKLLNAEVAKYVPGKEFTLLEPEAKHIVSQIVSGFEIASDTNPADGVNA